MSAVITPGGPGQSTAPALPVAVSKLTRESGRSRAELPTPTPTPHFEPTVPWGRVVTSLAAALWQVKDRHRFPARGVAAATRGGGPEPRGIFSQRCYRSDRPTLTTPVGVHLPCGSRFPGDELSHRFNPNVRLPRRWQWTLPSQGTLPSVDFRCGGQPPRWPVTQIRHRSRRGRLAHLQQKQPSGSQATLATGQVSNRSRADGRSPSCHALAMMDSNWARLVMAAGRVCRAQASIAVAGHRERSRSGRTAWTISSAARSAACCSPVPGRGSFVSSAAFGSVRTVSVVTRASSARGAISAASARRDTSRPSGDLAPVAPLVAVRHP